MRGLRDAATQKHLTLILSVHHGSKLGGHAVARHDIARDRRGALEVVRCTSCHLVHEDFFGDSTTEQNGDRAQQALLVHAVTITLRQLHRHAQRTSARDDRDLMNRIRLGQHARHNRVSRLVIGGVATLLFGHDDRAPLGTHDDLVLGFFKVGHVDCAAIAASGKQGCLVDQVGQIRTGKAGRATRKNGGVYVLCQRHLAHMHLENLLAATDVGQRHDHLTVKAPRTQERRIQHIGAVGCRDHDHTLSGLKPVHFNQHLVQRLLALIVAATEACAALTAHCVNFVDENDAGRVFFGVFEHVAHTGRTHADKHLHKIRTRDAEKRHLGLARNRLGQQGFTGTRRAHHQHAARDAPTQLLKLGGVTQKVHQLLHVLFGLVASSHIGKCDAIGAFIQHAGTRLAETECTALATALHLPHEKHPDANQQQHREPGHKNAHQQGRLLTRLA